MVIRSSVYKGEAISHLYHIICELRKPNEPLDPYILMYMTNEKVAVAVTQDMNFAAEIVDLFDDLVWTGNKHRRRFYIQLATIPVLAETEPYLIDHLTAQEVYEQYSKVFFLQRMAE